MGGVFKRGEVWYIRYEEPGADNGKRRQKMLACKGMNRKQAVQRLRDILTSLNTGAYVSPSAMSFAAYLDKWMEEYAKHHLGQATCLGYKIFIDRHVVPHIGKIELDKLRPLHLASLYNSLQDSGRCDGKGGLAAKTVRNIHGIVHAALAQAVKWQLLATNPADGVDPPRSIKPEIKTATQEDITKLQLVIGTSKYRMPALIALATGMRRGEVLGLKWEDFDDKKGTLCVRRALSQLTGTEILVKETKTGRARIVVVHESMVKELIKHRECQQVLKENLGCEYHDEGWICAKPDGTRITPSLVSKEFRRIAELAGVDITFHGLRHTQATALIMSGVPVKVVSERLGHSSTTITQDVYSHVLPHMQQQAADVIGKIMDISKNESSESVD